MKSHFWFLIARQLLLLYRYFASSSMNMFLPAMLRPLYKQTPHPVDSFPTGHTETLLFFPSLFFLICRVSPCDSFPEPSDVIVDVALPPHAVSALFLRVLVSREGLRFYGASLYVHHADRRVKRPKTVDSMYT